MSINLTKQQVKHVASSYMTSTGKYQSMFNQISSKLIAVKNNTIVIEVVVNYKWLANKSLEETRDQFLDSYKNHVASCYNIKPEEIIDFVVVIKRRAIYAINPKFTWLDRSFEYLVKEFEITETDSILKVFSSLK